MVVHSMQVSVLPLKITFVMQVRTKRDFGGVSGEANAHLWSRWQRESDELHYGLGHRLKRATSFRHERER